MTNNPRLPQKITIHVPLPIYGSQSYADITIERLDGKVFELIPFGYQQAQGTTKAATQWFLNYSGAVKATVKIQTTVATQWQRDNLRVEMPLELGLSMVSGSEKFTVVQGAIIVPLTFYNDINKDQVIRQLWATNNTKDILSLLVEPSGLHLQGTLPDPFYLGEQTSHRQPVTIRIPHTSDDVPSFASFNFSGKRFVGTLSAKQFSASLNAIVYIKKCAEKIENFRLSADSQRRMETFLDNVDCFPGVDCTVQFFRQDNNNTTNNYAQNIFWIAQALNTRMTIGGGISAEASFQPQFLTGKLQRQRQQQDAPWILESIRFESVITITNAPDIIPDIRLGLNKQTSASATEDDVQFSFAETQMQALSVPAITLFDNKYRAWLCITSGWLAIDSSNPRAEINPDADNPGAIFGSIEINKLWRGLQKNLEDNTPESSITGLQVQVGTLQKSWVVVKWSSINDAEQLSLELDNPMTTVITPPVWYQAPNNDSSKLTETNARFIPSLIAEVNITKSNENTQNDAAEVNKLSDLNINNLELSLQKRLVPGVFVSSNIFKMKGDKPTAQRLPIVANISWKEGEFQFQFKHGAITDKPEPQFTIDSKYIADLDTQQNPTESLQREYKNNNFELSPSAKISILQLQKQWLIIDEITNQSFIISYVNNKLYIYNPLFYLNKDIQNKLDNHNIDDVIRQQFSEKGLSLTSNAKIATEPSLTKRWFLFDPDANKEYLICLEGDFLNVYQIPQQQVLLWNRPVDYPIVQSFPLSPIKDEAGFLDSNRGLIPYQLQTEGLVKILFPERGLPQCFPNSPDLVDASSWQIITKLLTTRYFLPTLPGIELNLNDQPIKWIYRHSVPVLDEAYAEANESKTDAIANSGNVEGRDFTRVVGTEALTLIPSQASQTAFGWLHKTTSNLDGSVEIKLLGDDAALQQQLKGRFPHFELTLKNKQTGNNTPPILFSRDVKTSGGLTIPLQINSVTGATSSQLPEFTVEVSTDTSALSLYPIINNGQPLIANYSNADIKQVITLDGEGLVQAETIGEYSTYRVLNQDENRRLTKSFVLQPEIHLEIVGVPLGKFSRQQDLYQQSWMLHDGNGGWAKLVGFPLYPLCLREIEVKNGIFYLIIETILLHTTPSENIAIRPNYAGGIVTLTFTGSESNWYLKVAGEIDWRFAQHDEDNDEPRLARLQAKLKTQASDSSEDFVFENLQLAIAHPIGLFSLSELPSATCKIINSGVLQFEIPKTTKESFEFEIKSNYINVDQPLQPLDDYYFRWLDPTTSHKNNLELISGEALLVPGSQGQTIETKIQLVSRDATFRNEFGLFRVDNAQGKIGTLTPDNPKYKVAALSLDRRLATFSADAQELTVNLKAGEWMGMYLIQNNTAENFLKLNPENSVTKRPLAFFSFTAANPDLLRHVGSNVIEQGVRLSWEDRESGADMDFNDLVIDIKFLNLVWDLELESSSQIKMKDVLKWQDLATTISTSADSNASTPAKIIWQLSGKIQQILQAHPNLDDEEMRKDFLTALSECIQQHNLYKQDENAWSIYESKLPKGLLKLLHLENLQPEQRYRANRSLLTLAFTDIITQHQSQWSLDIYRGLVAMPLNRGDKLVSMPLKPYRIGTSKFIFAASTKQEQNLSTLGKKSWFKRLKSDSGLLGIEFNISLQGLPILETMIADLQFYLTDEINESKKDATQLLLRLKLHLSSHTKSNNKSVAEATGKIKLVNAIRFQDTLSTVEGKHIIKFYLDRVAIPELAALKIFSGEGFTETLEIVGIAKHEFTISNKTFYWQTPQTIRFTTLEQVTNSLLSKLTPRPTEFIFFNFNQLTVDNNEQIKVLQNVLTILQQNSQDTVDIEGHSDNRGTPEVKQRYSEQRAEAVQDWLINNGIEALRLTTRGLSDSRPRGDNSTSNGRAQNRRVEIIIKKIEPPTNIPTDKKSNLVIESSGVYEIRNDNQDNNSLKSKIPLQIADIENQFLQLYLYLRPRELQQLEQRQAHTVRLPFVACKEADIFPTIQLQQVSQDLVYRTFDTQGRIKPPLAENQTSEFDIFLRSTQARWLKSDNIHKLISQKQKIRELQPAYLKDGQIIQRLPQTLGDFEWLRNLNDANVLSAATLVTLYNSQGNDQSFQLPMVFEYPFTVEELAKTKVSETVDVQLIVFADRQLRRIAQDRIQREENQNNQPEKVEQWATDILRSKRRYDGAVVLKNFTETIFIPRPLETLREELSNIPSWSLEQADESARAYGEEIDPRCRLPQIILENSSSTGDTDTETDTKLSITLKADSNLGLLVFDAAPAISETPKFKSIAATRFRLAPTGDYPANFAGNLRPAKVTSDNSKLLTCTRWDEISFEQCQKQLDGEPSYPLTNPHSVINRPFPKTLLKTEDTKEVALLPPLIDIVTWASRPGEMTRSLWSLNSLNSKSQGSNQKLWEYAAASGVSISLRRPRSVAGLDESVRISVETSYPLVNYQFYYARLLLTQVLGSTPAPEPGKIYGVLTTKNNFYPFTVSDISQAKSSPALVYKNTQNQIEATKLYLLADKVFNYEEKDDSGNTIAKMVLRIDTDPELTNLSNDDFKNLDNLLTAQDNIWTRLTNSIYTLKISIIQNKITSDDVNLILVKYEFSPVEKLWKPKLPYYFIGAIKLLDNNNLIIAPKLGLALLASSNNQSKELSNNQLILSGYGRLDDDDFSPIKPLDTTDNNINWARTANLQILERMSTDVVREKAPYLYDVILYGSGGELIPSLTEIDPV